MRPIGDEVRHLAVPLTQDELLERGAALAAVLEEIQNEESRQQDIKTQLKATITAMEAQRAALATVVRRKAEYRDVRCDLFLRADAKMVDVVRRDTGELVCSRPAVDAEMQVGMFPADGGDGVGQSEASAN